MIENKFSSNPIHMDNQLVVDTENNVLKIKINKNSIFEKFKFIRKKNFILYLKYESKSFFSLFFYN